MIIVIIKMAVHPEKRRELSQTFRTIVEQVKKEPGCLYAAFYQRVEGESDYLAIEEWAHQEDVEEHIRSDIFKVLLGSGCLMQRPPEITIHTVSRSTKLKV